MLKLSVKVVAMGVVLVLLGAPVMACLEAGAQFAPEEAACCRAMRMQCGQRGMPESHSCCKTELTRPAPMVATAEKRLPRPEAIAILSVAASAAGPFSLQTSFDSRLVNIHAPPDTGPNRLPVLRI